MDISINTHNVELTERLNLHIERKTARLDRYMPNLIEVRVDLSTQQTRNAVERQVAQITVRDDRGTFLRAEERSSDMFAAIDAVIDKLYRQIKRYRGKRLVSRRSGGAQNNAWMGEPLPEEIEVEEASGEPSIVRHKRFPLRPMSPEEAIDQMELLGHSFFVYFDVDEESVNVVYKRHDGNYGVLQPEFD
jgi:putative sigma-54 modulation protein